MLSDSGTLTLETKDTICEDDIEVEYTKPSGGNNFPSVTVNDTTTGDTNGVFVLSGIYESNGKWLTVDPSEKLLRPTNFIPLYDSVTGYYTQITVSHPSGEDSLIVTANSQPISYDAGDGLYFEPLLLLATYDTPLTINISSKTE